MAIKEFGNNIITNYNYDKRIAVGRNVKVHIHELMILSVIFIVGMFTPLGSKLNCTFIYGTGQWLLSDFHHL